MSNFIPMPQQDWRLWIRLAGLTTGLVLLVIFLAGSGSHEVGALDLAKVLFTPDTASADAINIIETIRLPRICLGLLTGSMLAMAGAAMQSLTRNDLADPGLVGVKEGASVAVVALIVLFPSASLTPRLCAGMIGGIVTVLLVMVLARDLSRMRLILIGMGVSWMLAAALSLFITTGNVREVQTALLWLAGSLHTATWPLVSLALISTIIGATVLMATAQAADAAMIGEAGAAGLGVTLRHLMLLRLGAVVLLTATSVTCVGNLGFVGLIAPHLSRLSIGRHQPPLIGGSALWGACLVLMADGIGRLLFAPLQIPAGIVMAAVGTPLVLMLLWLRRDEI